MSVPTCPGWSRSWDTLQLTSVSAMYHLTKGIWGRTLTTSCLTGGLHACLSGILVVLLLSRMLLHL